MKFKIFKERYLEQAVKLALEEYKEESSIVETLPQNDYKELFNKMLSDMIDHDLGMVALKNDNLVGFITCYQPIENFFGTVKGAFSPIHGHGATKEDRYLIYSKLYQKVAERWVKQGILSHGIALYAHNTVSIDSFFHNGFGLRCIDAITTLDKQISNFEYNKDFEIEEISINEIDCILALKNKLIKHLAQSPTFLTYQKVNNEELKSKALKRKSRIFTISNKNRVIGYLEITDSGENFTCDHDKTINICGAYLIKEYRGKGLFESLLSFMFRKLKKEGYQRCGVDYESINPLADNFWAKHFTPYTYSVVRRIDERINLT